MYETFYGLSARPFANVFDRATYYAAESIEAARQTLARCIEREEGMALVIGAAGTGKSFLSWLIAQQLGEQYQLVRLRGSDVTSRRSLYQAVLRSLNLPYRLDEGELRLSLADYVEHGASNANGAIILVDEAQSLSNSLLEELRLITNLERGGRPWVRVVLFGGSELEERFASPKLESLNQRLAARCYLQPLSREETRAYVAQRIVACGASAEQIFTTDALDQVHTATDGVPRRINQICDHALVLAFAGGKRTISAAGIEEAWADLQQLPLPTARGRADEVATSSDIVEFGNLNDDEEELQPMGMPAYAPRAVASAERMTNPSSNLERIEAHLGKLEQEYRANPGRQPGVQFAFHEPRSKRVELFEQEELLVDKYAKLDAGTKVVAKQPGSLWPPIQAQFPSTTSGATNIPPAQPTIPALPETDDDMIVLEDDLETLPISSARPPVRRREYGQLFAKLRRG